MSKYTEIVHFLEGRITRGDYALNELPPEGQLADELGVARATARKAVNDLIRQGLLVRLPNGRAALNRKKKSVPANFTFLTPAYLNSNDLNLCRAAAKKAAAGVGANLRPVEYAHWDDPAIANVLRNSDGIFFKPWSEE